MFDLGRTGDRDLERRREREESELETCCARHCAERGERCGQIDTICKQTHSTLTHTRHTITRRVRETHTAAETAVSGESPAERKES